MRYVNTLYWSQKPNRRNDTVVGNASEGVLEEVAFELGLISAEGKQDEPRSREGNVVLVEEVAGRQPGLCRSL